MNAKGLAFADIEVSHEHPDPNRDSLPPNKERTMKSDTLFGSGVGCFLLIVLAVGLSVIGVVLWAIIRAVTHFT